ncbi:hypothetical protein IJ765_01040 [Candidatus Saccharibacteria bacterium]|nr:hypothetical protein [Candidatus Saccharibacteria bacterium]
MPLKSLKFKRGDTMIEVMFGIATFSLVSILSIAIMNLGIATAETNLEQTMARDLINAQAEAIRYIHDSYITERKNLTSGQEFGNLWNRLKSQHNSSSSAILSLQVNNCAVRYAPTGSESIFGGYKSFVINTRKIDATNPAKTIYSTVTDSGIFKVASLQPRLIFSVNGETTDDANISERSNDVTNTNVEYTTLKSAEGIWVTSVASESAIDGKPEFYDYHIQTCWNAPGQSMPTTIGTIIRLYNPELISTGSD